MCDQTEVQYLPGEVVWVKLRALWWPGLVQDHDELPEDITSSLKKRPLATVKFFQEDSYEYVNKLDMIYHYNCSRKHEFIKKGLDLCRKKSADRPSFMDTFPSDIVTAEELTHGDPNILQDEAFKPEEKPKYTSLFGSEKKKLGKKKGKDDSPLKDRVARRKKLTSKLQAMGWLSRGITANIIYPDPDDVPRIITHRRFLNKARNPDGKSDYEVRIMEQQTCEEEGGNLPEEPYRCVLCGYKTRRLNVIVIHFNTTHSRKATNIFSPPSILKGGSYRSPLLKLKGELRKSEVGRPSLPGRKRMSVKSKVDVKAKHIESEAESSDDEIVKPQPIKKEKGKPGRKRKVKVEEKEDEVKVETVKKPKVLDFLDDWEEDVEQEKETDDQDNKSLNKEDNDEDSNESSSAQKSPAQDTSSASKSKEIFEFDPDEDDNIELNLTPSVKGFGRRIPRVIESPKEKKKGSSETKKPTKERGNKKKEQEEKVDDFESLLAETSVPSLPPVPKSSTFSLDTDDVKSDELSDENKAILKEQNDSEKTKGGNKRQKNLNPEVDLAVDSKNPPQGRKETNTAKVTVEMVPELSVGANDLDDIIPQSNNEVLKSEGKPGQSTSGGDHTYVSGNSGRKRRRSLLPLEKSDGNMDVMSLPIVMGSDVAVEEAPRVNKQPFLPNVEGSSVVSNPPRRRGRPPKRGGRGSKSMRSPPPQASPKSPPHVRGSKSPSPRLGPKSPPQKSPMRRAGSMSPPYPGHKSPHHEQSPKSPDRTPKSPSHHHSSRSPKGHAQQSPKSPVRASMSPDPHRGHKSPPPHLSPKSPRSPHHSPIHQGPKSPQGLQSPKSPLMSIVSAAGPTSPKNSVIAAVSELKTHKSPPGSPVKTMPGDSALSGSKSPVRSPQGASVTQTVLLSSTKSASSRILSSSTSVGKAGSVVKKVNTSGAVVVQSQPDLQPEACGIGKILSSPTSVAASTSGTLKTIKVAVPTTPGSSPVVMGKAGTPGTRKVMIVQGKGGTQRMILPAETSQQILNNMGSGKKIILMSKGSSGSPGKLILTSQQQKLLASGGKVTTSSGQVVGSKGTVLSSVAKLVTSKPPTAGSSTGIALSTEPPALVKSEPKKTYKIISPQTKGSNILLNTSSGQILVPASSIPSGSGVNTPSGSKFVLPAGKNMKLLNAVTGSGQKIVLQMKSSPAKAGLTSPKTVQPIVPKTVQAISPKGTVQTVGSKTIQTLTKTIQPISPKSGQPVKFAKMATVVQPVPQLTPIGSPIQPNKVGRPKQVKPTVAKPVKSPTQAKMPRKSGVMNKPMTPGSVVASSSTTVVLPSASPQKRAAGIIPSPTLKPLSQAKPIKKVSLAAKPAPVETQVAPQPVQVVTSAVPPLDQIQTTLMPSVDSNSAITLPTSTQQLIAVPTEDGGQVMYLIDNSSLLGLDGGNQTNLNNVILTFDNMVQPTVSSGTSDFTFSAPGSGQDILAEALANTQVLQSDGAGGDLGLDTSGLLSSHTGSTMFPPTLSHGVLETSLTLNQPIMTPLEDLSGVSTLQPPPVSSSASSVDLPSTIPVPDITISTSSYSSLPIPSATIQSTVFSDSQSVSTFSTTVSGDGGVFIESTPVEGESFLTSDTVYEPAGEGASMPSLDG